MISHRNSQGDEGMPKNILSGTYMSNATGVLESNCLKNNRSWQLQNSNELVDLDRTIEQSGQETSDR